MPVTYSQDTGNVTIMRQVFLNPLMPDGNKKVTHT